MSKDLRAGGKEEEREDNARRDCRICRSCRRHTQRNYLIPPELPDVKPNERADKPTQRLCRIPPPSLISAESDSTTRENANRAEPSPREKSCEKRELMALRASGAASP